MRTLLPFTRSVELAEKRLQSLATGGKTPLAPALEQACRTLAVQRIREPRCAQLLVLVTDGRANVSRDGDPVQEALTQAQRAAGQPFRALVLDTERGFARFGLAKKLAEALGADYLALSEISDREIEAGVRQAMQC